MSIEQELIKAGYVKSVSEHYKLLKMTDILCQKRVSDEHGIKYFVNAWVFPERTFPNGTTCPEGVMFEVQFWTVGKESDNTDHVDVTLSIDDAQLAEIEFDNIWRRMGYGYYEKWDAA